jgi:pimeloyl-ACP methyl ester carboxylesterase
MFYEPIPEERPTDKMPVLIYMHGNAGCRLEAEAYVPHLLTQGINVFAFDFSGCGQSEGEWVTLGWKETKDLQAVINHLQSLGTVSKIGLWGRSMGAATSIMYLAENHDKAHAAVLDSGFATLQDVIN